METMKLVENPKPGQMRLFHEPPGTLRLTVDDALSYMTVKVYQASPLSRPGQFLSFQDGKGEEIVLVSSLTDLPEESRKVAEGEIRRRYLTAKVLSIPEIKTEFGVTYWHVVTDRGERDFVVQSISESCVWLSDTHILVIDADGNRFEIEDKSKLDAASQVQLESVL